MDKIEKMRELSEVKAEMIVNLRVMNDLNSMANKYEGSYRDLEKRNKELEEQIKEK